MASETTTVTAASTTEYEKGVPPPPPPESNCRCYAWDALLRVLLLVASVVAVVVMVTSNQTKLIPVPLPGGPALVPKSAKFHYSPAFIYLVAALSVAGLYSIITGLASLYAVWKPSIPAKCLFFLILTDVLILGVVASATGTAGGVTYVGLKGNSHVNWNKICGTYGKFCRYVGSSVFVSLFASLVLVLLIIGNAYALYRRVDPKC